MTNVLLERETKETRIRVELDLNGGASNVKTPYPFLTHMVSTLARHSGFALQVAAESKDQDEHHLTEDVAITLGQAVRQAVGDRPIQRFAHETIPMDDALVECVMDLGGRSYYEGRLPDPMFEHVMRSFAHEVRANVHITVLRGRDQHHIIEAAFKGLARCLRTAVQPAPEHLSTKGEVSTRGR
jgi:imidazoleglycerol-phosphate dehydratase